MNWDDYRWYKCYGPNTKSWNQDLIIKVDSENLLNNKMKKKEGYKEFLEGEMNGLNKYALILKDALDVKKIIHSGRCTIVIWKDGSKTIVKQSEDDDWDEYAAFCAAFCKKVFGSTSAVKRIIDKKTVPYRPTKVEKESKEANWIRQGYGLIADSKEQADRFKARIIDRITMFGRLSVAGLYEIFEDNSKPVLDEYYYGWDSINNIYYKKQQDEYWFYLPKPKQIMKRDTDAGAGEEEEKK